MDKVIMKYNPAFLSPEELVVSFVVRHGELETIMRIIKENVTKSNQHILVIGPRGIGKTMLVLRAAEETRRDKELSKKWYPLVFSEESYQVSTCGEFWLESLFHLGQQPKNERWQRTYEELKDEVDEKRLRERVLAQLMDFADEQGKRILLVVENFNMLLGDQLSDEDAWAMRHTLQNEPRIMLLASATSRFEQVEVEGKPMFDLFRFIDLKPLDGAECRALWASVTGQKLNDRRMRPLKILTGGNPRLLAIVSNFAAKMSLKELMNDLLRLVDEHTEYFKSHLDNLPAVERKVYLALAEIYAPATTRRVAKVARLNINKTSSLLGRLIARGAVVETNGRTKAKEYQVAERMYNIYYLMRRRVAASGRVKALVHFMVGFYGVKELVKAAKSIAEEACQLALADRSDHYMTYTGVVEQIGDTAAVYKIVRNTPQDFFASEDIPAPLRKLFKSFSIAELPNRVLAVLKESERLRKNPKKLKKEERYFRDFINDHPEDYTGRAALGTFLHICAGHLEEAEKAYRNAIRIDPKQGLAWKLLGKLLEDQGRYKEAEQVYLNVTELSPNESANWVALGDLYHLRLQCFEDAERVYRRAVGVNPRDKVAWFELGTLLGENLEQYDESTDALQKAVNLDPKNAGAWNNLGLALKGGGKFEEAEKAFRKAINLAKESACPLANLGLLSLCRNQFEEGEKCLREALKQDPNYYTAAGPLALLLVSNDSQRDEGWEILKGLVKNAEIAKNDVNFSTSLLTTIAAIGYEREVLDILKKSPWAETLEPVVVALRLCLGEDVKAAAEVMEVAKDVVKQIEEMRDEMQPKRKTKKKIKKKGK